MLWNIQKAFQTMYSLFADGVSAARDQTYEKHAVKE